MIQNEKENLSAVQKIILDVGYTGKKFASEIKIIINANVEVIKRNELHSFVVLPKRWVVERSFAWLGKCRRLWKNCERKLNRPCPINCVNSQNNNCKYKNTNKNGTNND